MTEQNRDLWGDFTGAPTIQTPVDILREQADLLTSKTKGILKGIVTSKISSIVVVRFAVEVGRLDYRVTLLEVCHQVESPYPAKEGESFYRKECKEVAGDETTFRKWVHSRLTGHKVRGTISTLLSLAKSSD